MTNRPKNRREIRSPEISANVEVRHYSGPIPPSSELEKYEKVLPGAAERILEMAEVEQSHRHGLDKAKLTAETFEAEKARNERNLGRYLGSGVMLAGIGAAGLIGTIGGSPATAAAIVTALATSTLLVSFVSSKKKE